MKKIYIVLTFISLASKAQTTYFEQNFSTGTPLTQYVNASPTSGQFTSIGNGTSLSVDIVNQALEFDRQVDNTSRGYAARTVDFSPLPTSFYIQFKFQVESTSIGGTNAVKFYVGSGFSNTTPNPSNSQVYARFAIDIQDDGSYAMNPLPSGGGGTNSRTFSGWQTITFILNKVSSNLNYLTPNGVLEQQPIDTYDLWVGNVKVFDNQPALTPSQILSDFRLSFEDGISKIAFDDFLFRDISGVLPVTLVSFNAKPISNAVQVSWSTTSEQNADYFEVQRNHDLVGEFTTVGKAAAKGTTDQRQYYGLTDSRPLDGPNYYRLKQVDVDGQIAYSKTISVVMDGQTPALELLGNPSNGQEIHVAVRNLAGATYQLSTITGRELPLRVDFQANGSLLLLPAQPLLPGLYLLRANDGTKQFIQKVLVE